MSTSLISHLHLTSDFCEIRSELHHNNISNQTNHKQALVRNWHQTNKLGREDDIDCGKTDSLKTAFFCVFEHKLYTMCGGQGRHLFHKDTHIFVFIN